MEHKRLTLFAGHYGSGKTNIAVNYALWLRKTGNPVSIADLDIVNPYFRTKDSEEMLRNAGIGLICSEYAGTNLDAPAMPPEVYGLLENRELLGVMDIGGDDRGALALGRYAPAILEENDYEMLFVINSARPLTRNAADTLEVKQEIETACHLPFTAIVNNTNLGTHTTAEDVLRSMDYAKAVSEACGLPIKMHCCDARLYADLQGKAEPLFPLTLQRYYYHIQSEVSPWQN